MSPDITQKIRKLPDSPGVYFFKDDKGNILYIGKAASLKDRVRSYFNGRIRESRGAIIEQMVNLSFGVDFKKTDSVLEALILEAKLIKKHQPPYNIKEKDDKSFNYVIITKEDFPKVLVVREKELKTNFDESRIKYSFGPFPQASTLKEALKLIRKIFPFRDNKCVSYEELKDKSKAKPCFSRQIGLCPGVCTGEVSKKEYSRTIQHLRLLFEGRKQALVKKLEKEMNEYAQKQEFEKAEELKRKIFKLKHVQDISLLKNQQKAKDLNEDSKKNSRISETSELVSCDEISADKVMSTEMSDMSASADKLTGGDFLDSVSEARPSTFRIEAYDAAHTAGSDSVGAMVVLEGGEIRKSEYKKFAIKEAGEGDDIGALREILERRFKHTEWSYPDLIVIDGGKTQRNTAVKIIEKQGFDIPVVSVIKDERHKPKNILGSRKIKKDLEKDILLANYEAHRFAISYHRKKRSSR